MLRYSFVHDHLSCLRALEMLNRLAMTQLNHAGAQ